VRDVENEREFPLFPARSTSRPECVDRAAATTRSTRRGSFFRWSGTRTIARDSWKSLFNPPRVVVRTNLIVMALRPATPLHSFAADSFGGASTGVEDPFPARHAPRACVERGVLVTQVLPTRTRNLFPNRSALALPLRADADTEPVPPSPIASRVLAAGLQASDLRSYLPHPAVRSAPRARSSRKKL